jgi:hypothetical protein
MHSRMTLLHACAIRLIIETEHDVTVERAHWRVLNRENPWRVFTRGLINAGAEISAVDTGGHSPFHAVLRYLDDHRSDLDGPVEVFIAWLIDLKEAGVGLEQYGQTELALHEALVINSECCRNFPRRMSFTYGLRVEDWSILLRAEEETSESTQEETQVEKQGTEMPGSWRDFGGENDSESEEHDSGG